MAERLAKLLNMAKVQEKSKIIHFTIGADQILRRVFETNDVISSQFVKFSYVITKSYFY